MALCPQHYGGDDVDVMLHLAPSWQKQFVITVSEPFTSLFFVLMQPQRVYSQQKGSKFG